MAKKIVKHSFEDDKNVDSKRPDVIIRELTELLYISDKQLNSEIKILKKEDLN